MIAVAEQAGWTGKVAVTIRRHPGLEAGCDRCRLSLAGQCDQPEHTPIATRVTAGNIITNVGKNWLRDAFQMTSFNAGTRYMAWGSGVTAPAATQTQLITEAGRKTITSFADGATGVKTTTVYLGPEDANSTLAELGWFASSTATATTNSGVMIARVLFPGGSYPKVDTESIQVDRTDTIS